MSATSQYTPIACQFLGGKRTIFVLRWCTRTPTNYAGAGVVGRFAERFQAFFVAWSWFRQAALSRPAHQYPEGV